MQQKTKKRDRVKTLAVCAILAVLGFILDRFVGINFPLFGNTSLMVNMSYVPIFMAGILYGPLWGALVGGVQDCLCMIIVPLGAPIWGITFTTMLAGVIAGLFGRFVLKITPQNRSELLSPAPEADNSKISLTYVISLLVTAVYGVLLFFPAVSFASAGGSYVLSVWQILINGADYRAACLDVLGVFETRGFAQATLSWSEFSNTMLLISILFVAAIILAAASVFLCASKKKLISTVFSVFGFLFSGIAAATLLLQIPKTLKDTGVDVTFSPFPYVSFLLCCVIMILVLMRTDILKFKISAFCAFTAILSSVLNSLWISMTYSSVGFVAYLLPRLASAVFLSAPLYSFLLYYLLVNAKWLKKLV